MAAFAFSFVVFSIMWLAFCYGVQALGGHMFASIIAWCFSAQGAAVITPIAASIGAFIHSWGTRQQLNAHKANPAAHK